MTNSSGRRIALFGGAFDPPHLGHAVVIRTVLESGLVDELWLLPSGAQRYDKSAQVSPAQRLALCQLFLADCFSGDARLRIETADLDGKIQDSATMKALDNLRERHPTSIFFVVIGADNIKNLASWKYADRLSREARFLAVTRGGQAFSGKVPSNVELIQPAQASAISSTNVRNLLRAKASLSGLLTSKVLQFILDNRLYQSA